MQKWTTILAVLFFSMTTFASKPPRIAALTVIESYTLPAQEISGMAWRTNPQTKRRELVVVGDRDHKLWLVDWENRKKAFTFKEVDLKPLEASSEQQSQWESVFSDETGRVFIIQEFPARILVVAADLKSIEATMVLSLGQPSDNSGGEGLLPLKSGHMLVLKEKDPLQIIEYAPQGAKAKGYKKEMAIERQGAFPLPPTAATSFQKAFTWKFSTEYETLLEDSSGLNVDEKGELYILSDQRNLIGHIGTSLATKDDLIKLKKLWSLPSTIKQPEGMVIDEDSRPIIAIDSKKTNVPNIFLLSNLK